MVFMAAASVSYAEDISWDLLVIDYSNKSEKTYHIGSDETLHFKPVSAYKCDVEKTEKAGDIKSAFYQRVMKCHREGSQEKVGSVAGCLVLNGNKKLNPADTLLMYKDDKLLFSVRMNCI